LLRYRKGLSTIPGIAMINPEPTDGVLIWIVRAISE